MKVVKITNRNGRSEFLVSESYGYKGKFFETSSSRVVTVKARPYLYILEDSNEGRELESLNALQYDGSRAISNLEGYASVSFVLGLLRSRGLLLNDDYLPYSEKDYLTSISYGELGYLLTYACREESGFPILGKYKPSDPRMRVSVISVESGGSRIPEFRLGQYSSDSLFERYRDDIRTGSRPVPLPLFYGFMEYFSEDGSVSLLGQVPRGEVLRLVGAG